MTPASNSDMMPEARMGNSPPWGKGHENHRDVSQPNTGEQRAYTNAAIISPEFLSCKENKPLCLSHYIWVSLVLTVECRPNWRKRSWKDSSNKSLSDFEQQQRKLHCVLHTGSVLSFFCASFTGLCLTGTFSLRSNPISLCALILQGTA